MRPKKLPTGPLYSDEISLQICPSRGASAARRLQGAGASGDRTPSPTGPSVVACFITAMVTATR